MTHSRNHDGSKRRSFDRLSITLGLVALYMVAEVVGGLLTNSLALLADAGHMLSDASSLALALVALWIAQKPRSRNGRSATTGPRSSPPWRTASPWWRSPSSSSSRPGIAF